MRLRTTLSSDLVSCHEYASGDHKHAHVSLFNIKRVQLFYNVNTTNLQRFGLFPLTTDLKTYNPRWENHKQFSVYVLIRTVSVESYLQL